MPDGVTRYSSPFLSVPKTEGAEVQETAAQKKARLKAEKEAGEAADAVGEALVAFEHFVEAGTMVILDKVYEIKDFVVEVLPEHAVFADFHGLKPKK